MTHMFSDVLLTVDYDRTLTAPDSSIPQRNLEAIRYFMENGGAFTINTGRSIPMIADLKKLVPVNAPLLLYNGSAAYDLKTEQLTFYHEIQAQMEPMIKAVRAAFPDMTVEVQGMDAHYRFKEEDPAWDRLCDHCHCARGYASPGKDLGPFLKFSLYGEIRSPRISGMFEGSPQELERIGQVQQQLLAMYGDTVEVFRSAARILDVHAKGVSKGRSALELKAQLGRKILVCAGDGENDLPMMEAADFAFCPADAPIADRYQNVCKCGDGAVADVIYREIPKILKDNT